MFIHRTLCFPSAKDGIYELNDGKVAELGVRVHHLVAIRIFVNEPKISQECD